VVTNYLHNYIHTCMYIHAHHSSFSNMSLRRQLYQMICKLRWSFPGSWQSMASRSCSIRAFYCKKKLNRKFLRHMHIHSPADNYAPMLQGCRQVCKGRGGGLLLSTYMHIFGDSPMYSNIIRWNKLQKLQKLGGGGISPPCLHPCVAC